MSGVCRSGIYSKEKCAQPLGALQRSSERIGRLAGIRQGCPLSGAVFATALEPLIRTHLRGLTFASSRIVAFADDVLCDVRPAFIPRVSLRPLGRRDGPRARVHERQAPRRGRPLLCEGAQTKGSRGGRGAEVVRVAFHLGAAAGPEVANHQWRAVVRRHLTQAPLA